MTGYPASGTNLVDILDRVLDKGLVVAGDIKIAVANVELLTVRIRLLVCSIDKAEQIGLNWWRYDPSLVHPGLPAGETAGALPAGAAPAADVARLEARIAELEQQLAAERQGALRPVRSSPPPGDVPSGGGRPSAPRRQRRRTE